MSQVPPPYPPAPGQPPPLPLQPTGVPMAAARGNGFAVASLVCGVLLIIPFITGALAVLFGFLGLKRSRETRTGRGLAIAGLTLGVIGVVLWLFFGGAILALVRGTEDNRQLARDFIRDMSQGNVAAAAARADGTISQAELQRLSDLMQAFGPFKDLTTNEIQVQSGRVDLAGTAEFANVTKRFEMVQSKVNDQWRVSGVAFK